MKRVPESDSSNADPGPWVSVKLQTASLRSHSTGTKQSAVFAHRLNLLSLFPVQSHHLVSRAQGAREGLNPQTRENGVSTDAISRAATKCIRKVLTWRLIEEHIQERNPTSVPGKAAPGSSLVRMNWRGITANTREWSHSSAQTVTAASPGQITWHCTAGGTCWCEEGCLSSWA